MWNVRKSEYPTQQLTSLLLNHECGLFRSKDYRHGEVAPHGLAFMLGRSPFRHAFQYSDGFLVEDRDKTFLHLDVAQTSVLVDGETKDDSAYWCAFLTFFWILKVCLDVLRQCSRTAWE